MKQMVIIIRIGRWPKFSFILLKANLIEMCMDDRGRCEQEQTHTHKQITLEMELVFVLGIWLTIHLWFSWAEYSWQRSARHKAIEAETGGSEGEWLPKQNWTEQNKTEWNEHPFQ